MYDTILISQIIALVCVAWLIWGAVRHFVLPSTLDNIPGPKPSSLIFGSIAELFDIDALSFHQGIWQKFGPVIKIQTFLGRPMLYVYDPKALHHIIIKDQYLYEETPTFLDMNFLITGPSLLSSLGDEHRRQRKMLNPIFHINNMRYMSSTFYRVAHQLRQAILKEVKNGPKEIEMLHWTTRTALELLGQGGFGHSFDSLEDETTNLLIEDMKGLFEALLPFLVISRFIPVHRLMHIGNPKIRRWIVENIPSKRIKRCIQIIDHLNEVIRDILARKRTALASGDETLLEQVDQGKDLMSVLLRANVQAAQGDRMADAELLGHMCSLMSAATDTTSGALARILHTLAHHPDAQERLRQEITEARHGDGDIDYDRLVALPYLEAVCKETLRLHAPMVTMDRITQENVVMPLSNPIKGNDGRIMSNIAVPKGTIVTVGILASNCNEEIWGPDALEWKPERMTFLGGGRGCIGFKLAQMEMKIVLAVLLETFKFSPTSKEIRWSLGGIQSPAVGKESKKSLPLNVELVSSLSS